MKVLAKVTLPPGKESYRLGRRLGWLQSLSGHCSEEGKLIYLLGLWPRFRWSSSSSVSLYID